MSLWLQRLHRYPLLDENGGEKDAYRRWKNELVRVMMSEYWRRVAHKRSVVVTRDDVFSIGHSLLKYLRLKRLKSK